MVTIFGTLGVPFSFAARNDFHFNQKMNSKDNFIALLKFYSFIHFYFAFTVAQNTNDIPTVENTTLHEHSCFSQATLIGVAFGCIMATLVVTVILCMIVWYYFSKRKKPVTNSNGKRQCPTVFLLKTLPYNILLETATSILHQRPICCPDSCTKVRFL